MRVKEKNGITLIALVVTIIVLLILARNIYKYVNRTKWNIK
jgi:Tfp pilus assembly protein PilE